jgi:predicted ATP-binding protein involved in virulence
LPKDLSAEDLVEATSEGQDIVQSLWFPKNGEWIHLSEMSSGELTMFNRFFPLIQAMEDHAVVLIDEPETHLHPRWIQQYIHMLTRLFGGYDAHILLATHSPLIASDVPRECIVGLLQGEDGRIETYEVQDTTLGGGATEILQAVFRVEETQGRFSAEAMQRVRAELDCGELETAMSIYRDLSTTPEKFELYRAIRPYLEQE